MKKSRVVVQLFLAFIILFFIFLTLTFGWIVNKYLIPESHFGPGSLEPKIEIYAWDKKSADSNKWVLVPDKNNGGGIRNFYPDFGEVSNIDTLPEDCAIYLKMKVTNQENYKYNIILSNIVINIFDYQKELIPDDELKNINYYTDVPNQKCFDYSYFIGENNLDPINNFSIPNIHLDTKNQVISENYIEKSSWLYVKIEVRLLEIQNIYKYISMDYMPYYIEFVFNIKGEARSIDEDE